MKRIQLIDEKDKVWFLRAVSDEEFERIFEILELTKDVEALPILDKVIAELKAPKKEMASKIAGKIAKAKNLEGELAKALMVLPKKDLEQMVEHVDSLEIERKHGRDCLTLKAKEKTWTLPL